MAAPRELYEARLAADDRQALAALLAQARAEERAQLMRHYTPMRRVRRAVIWAIVIAGFIWAYREGAEFQADRLRILTYTACGYMRP